jgi:hypothetical protein
MAMRQIRTRSTAQRTIGRQPMMTDGDLLPWPPGGLSEKIFRRHREHLAIVYIRQSAVQQVERHQESTRLQYALVDRAFHLVGRGRASWWSMTILAARVQRSKAGSAFSARWRKSASAVSGWCSA